LQATLVIQVTSKQTRWLRLARQASEFRSAARLQKQLEHRGEVLRVVPSSPLMFSLPKGQATGEFIKVQLEGQCFTTR